MQLLQLEYREALFCSDTASIVQILELDLGPRPPGSRALISGCGFLAGRPVMTIGLPLGKESAVVPLVALRHARIALVRSRVERAFDWAIEIDRAYGFIEGTVRNTGQPKAGTPRWLGSVTINSAELAYVDLATLVNEFAS